METGPLVCLPQVGGNSNSLTEFQSSNKMVFLESVTSRTIHAFGVLEGNHLP